MHIISAPITKEDFNQYYQLRWETLRKPWNQPEGSEKDELDKTSIHRMALVNDKVVAVARLHFLDDSTAQVRYMAVDKDFEQQGMGKAVYLSLEEEARKNKIKTIILNAREQAIGFYEKLGFSVTRKTYLLFDEIQHYEMQKDL